MKVQTTRFGTIEVQEDQVVTLVDGMLGFSGCGRFTIMTDEIGEPFKWFQSLDIPSLAFVVIDPAVILPNYHFSVRRDQIKQLEVDSVDDLQVYVIVTMSGNILDVDTRHRRVMLIALKVMKHCIYRLLEKHKTVVVRLVEGSHDKFRAIIGST